MVTDQDPADARGPAEAGPHERGAHERGAKIVLIVGNSDGIGAALAEALLRRGDRVVGISRSASPIEHPRLRHERHDVASPGFPTLLQRILAEEGGIDVCVYCVGIGSDLQLPDLSGEAYVFDVNLTAMVRAIDVLIPHWLQRGSGHLIGLSSMADDLYIADAPSYSASKAGVSNYLISLGLKLRPRGVCITNIRFGFVDTKMAKAPVRPMMLTREGAADHIIDCIRRRPLQLSVPKTIGALVRLVGWGQSIRVWLT